MTVAMEDCERGMPVRKAARIHQVPRQTLQDRVSGGVVHGSRSGGPTMLSPQTGKDVVEKFQSQVLSMRRPDNLDRARAACATWEVVDQFYTLLEGTLEALRLKDKPSQIYNCDLTGFAMERGREKVLVLSTASPVAPGNTWTWLHWLPPIQRRPVQRLPVVARMITASEYEHQYLEKVEKERAGNAVRQRPAALKRQREGEGCLRKDHRGSHCQCWDHHL
ncbi:hypothetical protein SKAU_G00412480 [Synaphobranchus kaupii]|uniref:HTH psq-type domain-containing protein n=1 Tax=Synaphobranchus kaupii TaxID=118154 RepID=A0A9Q1IBU6_SYNKA|nr:hypothetical protein SKAU_G00412480 [Synaphobranchus kaupii]